MVVNASDVRSGDQLCQIIRNAMEMNDIKNASKPTCLILDEVDGALGSSEGESKGIRQVAEYL